MSILWVYWEIICLKLNYCPKLFLFWMLKTMQNVYLYVNCLPGGSFRLVTPLLMIELHQVWYSDYLRYGGWLTSIRDSYRFQRYQSKRLCCQNAGITWFTPTNGRYFGCGGTQQTVCIILDWTLLRRVITWNFKSWQIIPKDNIKKSSIQTLELTIG